MRGRRELAHRRGMAKRTGSDELVVRARVCGHKGCKEVSAVVDTGATGTVISERLAKAIGVRIDASGTATTMGGSVSHGIGMAAMCVEGCACGEGPVAVAPNVARMGGGGIQVLIGMDYLRAAGAMIDAAKLKLSCGTASGSRRYERKGRSRAKRP